MPPKWKNTIHDELKDVPDGKISINTGNIKTDDFKQEKGLIEYIVLNIEKFCQDTLNDELISFETEYKFDKSLYGNNGKRVDLFVICLKRKYLIEAKVPSCQCENRYAIGQLLDYGREYLDSKKEMPGLIIITTNYDMSTAKTIQCFNLPIRYIYFDKKRTLELNDGE